MKLITGTRTNVITYGAAFFVCGVVVAALFCGCGSAPSRDGDSVASVATDANFVSVTNADDDSVDVLFGQGVRERVRRGGTPILTSRVRVAGRHARDAQDRHARRDRDEVVTLSLCRPERRGETTVSIYFRGADADRLGSELIFAPGDPGVSGSVQVSTYGGELFAGYNILQRLEDAASGQIATRMFEASALADSAPEDPACP